MVRLADLPEVERQHALAKPLPPFESQPWVAGPPLRERRVALMTSAGLHRVGDRAFSLVDLGYRVIPGSVRGDELTMTHSSVHFDRTASGRTRTSFSRSTACASSRPTASSGRSPRTTTR